MTDFKRLKLDPAVLHGVYICECVCVCCYVFECVCRLALDGVLLFIHASLFCIDPRAVGRVDLSAPE